MHIDPSLVRDYVHQGDDVMPKIVGRIAVGGLGNTVYQGYGAGSMATTLKTYGQGPGRATGLYRMRDGTVRMLSPWECLRAHSFPEKRIRSVMEEDFPYSVVYRLAGNSIPVLTLRDLLLGILRSLSPQAFSDRPL